MLSEIEINNKFENKKEMKENDYLQILKENNYKNDLSILVTKGLYYIIDNYYKCYIVYKNMSEIDKLIKYVSKKELENMPIMDYSEYKENVNYYLCKNKCINSFGKSEKCLKCNYYKNCLIENEISNFEKLQNEKLNNFYDMLENDFYR